MMIERVLVATDFSPAGRRAVQAAANWAKREKAALRLLHVAPSKRQLARFWRTESATVRAVHRQAAEELQRLVEDIDPARQLEISTGVVNGTASRKIASAVKDFRADLLVVGARGENETTTGQPGLGGTASKLVSTTPCALFLVRHAPQLRPAKVLASVDLSRASFAVLSWAARCATGGSLHALHVYDVPFASRLQSYGIAEGAIDVYTDGEHQRLDRELVALIDEAGCGPNVQRLVERGDAAARLFRQIDKLSPTVVVLGTHTSRNDRPSNTRYGSVCRYTAFFSPTDVLVTPRAISPGSL